MTRLFHVFTIVTAAFHAVSDVEARLGAGNGVTKKLAAVAQVMPIVSTIGMALGVPVPPAALDGAIGGIIDGVVFLKNFFGVFTHSTPAAKA